MPFTSIVKNMVKPGTVAIALSVFTLSAFTVQAQTAKKPTNKAVPTAIKNVAKPASLAPNTPIISVGTLLVPVDEFEYVYKKNNTNPDSLYLEKNIRDYLQLFGNFKLKVLDAQSAGMDTTTSYKKELETYRKQLAAPYLTEKSVTDKLVKEAYERLKTEINASHILLMVSPDANPKDTLTKFKKMQDIRNRALKGEDFEELAREFSEDPSVSQNGGNLGFFTALNMLYQFEDAAYKTPVGSVSKIVRTRYGYHILKVNSKRPASGQVKVAHIMVKYQSNQPKADSVAAREKINELAKKIANGENFETLAQQFSDDQGTKEKGGVLPMFGTGQMIPSFEEAAFSIKKVGDVSKPFQTQYGFHIAKLLERKPLESFEEKENELRDKIKRDSRSELNEAAFLARLRRENKLKENVANQKLAFATADTNLTSGKWKFKADATRDEKTLFSINSKNYSVGSFLNFVQTNQPAHKSTDLNFAMKLHYKDFMDKALKEYEEENLEAKYEDFRMLMKEYREGILLFSRMDEKVWSKAVEDTAGLRKFFLANNAKYKWGRRAKATIYNAKDVATLEKVKQLLAQKNFEVSEPKFDDLAFEKNSNKIDVRSRATLQQISNMLRLDKSLSVVLNASADAKEKSKVSARRAKSAQDSLIRFGVEPSRISIKDLGKAKSGSPADNQKVSVTVLSNAPKALERTLNNNAPLTLQVNDGFFQKGDNKLIDGLEWKVGSKEFKEGDRNYLIIISSIEEPRNKTLEECRGIAISDYQTQLEQEWLTELRKKYPILIFEPTVKALSAKKKK